MLRGFRTTSNLGNLGLLGSLSSLTGAPAFSPNDVAGLLARFRADSITGLSDGAAVATWSDTSGNNNHATQATAGNKPIWKSSVSNGLPCVRFDGAGDYMQLTTHLTQSTLSVFIVASKASGTGYQHIFDSQKILMLTYEVGPAGWGLYLGGEVGAGQVVSTTPRIMSAIVRAATDVDLYTDGTNKLTTGGSAYQAQAQTTIGGDTSTSSHNGDIYEILVYNGALSSADIASVHGYLKTRYNIA